MDDEDDLQNLRRAVMSSIPENSNDVRYIQRKENKKSGNSQYSHNSKRAKDSERKKSSDELISSDLRGKLNRSEDIVKHKKILEDDSRNVKLSSKDDKEFYKSMDYRRHYKHENENQLFITVSNQDSRKIAAYSGSDEERDKTISSSYNIKDRPSRETGDVNTEVDESGMDSDYTIEVNSQNQSDKDDSDSVYSIELKNIGGSESDNSDSDQQKSEDNDSLNSGAEHENDKQPSHNEVLLPDSKNIERTVSVTKLGKSIDLGNDQEQKKQYAGKSDIKDKKVSYEVNRSVINLEDKQSHVNSNEIKEKMRQKKNSGISYYAMVDDFEKESIDTTKHNLGQEVKEGLEKERAQNKQDFKQHSKADVDGKQVSVSTQHKKDKKELSTVDHAKRNKIHNETQQNGSENAAVGELTPFPSAKSKSTDEKRKQNGFKQEKEIDDLVTSKMERSENSNAMLSKNDQSQSIDKEVKESIDEIKTDKKTVQQKLKAKEGIKKTDGSKILARKPLKENKSVSSSSSCSTCSGSSSDSSDSSSDTNTSKASSPESSSSSSDSSSSSSSSDSDNDSSSSSSSENNFKRKKRDQSRDKAASSSRRQRSRSPIRERSSRYVSPLRTDRSEWGKPRQRRDNEHDKQRSRSNERARYRFNDRSRRSRRRSPERSYERSRPGQGRRSEEYSRQDRSRYYRDRYRSDDRKKPNAKQNVNKDTERSKLGAENLSQRATKKGIDEKPNENLKFKEVDSNRKVREIKRNSLSEDAPVTKKEFSSHLENTRSSKNDKAEKQTSKRTKSSSPSSRVDKEKIRNKTRNDGFNHEAQRKHAKDNGGRKSEKEEEQAIESKRKNEEIKTAEIFRDSKEVKSKIERKDKKSEEKPRPLMEITLTGMRDASKNYGRLSKRKVNIRDSASDVRFHSHVDQDNDSMNRKIDRKGTNDDSSSPKHTAETYVQQVKKLSSGKTVLLDRSQIQPLMKPIDFDILKPVRVVKRKDDMIEDERATKRIVMDSTAKNDSRSVVDITSNNKTESAPQTKRKVFSRLGKQILGKSKSISINLKEQNKTEKKPEDDGDKPVEEELDSRIKEIREKNEAILRRQKEIEDDIKMHS